MLWLDVDNRKADRFCKSFSGTLIRVAYFSMTIGFFFSPFAGLNKATGKRSFDSLLPRQAIIERTKQEASFI